MAILNIRQLGDECLTKKCKMVTAITPRIEQLIDDMYDTMYEANGVGLAAPQVGILKRIVVIDTTPEPEEGEEPDEEYSERFTMINPYIVSSDGEQRGTEGCLSYKGMCGIVTRPSHVIAHYTDIDGNDYEVEAEGLLARAICHELDHLDGIMYTKRAEGPCVTNEEMDLIQKEQAEKLKSENQ